jgi:hypothetical protein
VCDHITVREQQGAFTELKFVYSHLLDKQAFKNGKWEAKMEHMRKLYQEGTQTVLQGNEKADKAARTAAGMAPPYDLQDAQQAPFSLKSQGQEAIEADHIRGEICKRRYEARMQSYDQSHRQEAELRQHPNVDKAASQFMLRGTDVGRQPLRQITRRARMDALQTRQKLHAAVQRADEQGYTSAWIEKIRPHNRSPRCPLGCRVPEDLQHVAECQHTVQLRKDADRMINNLLTEHGHRGPKLRWLCGDSCDPEKRIPAELKLKGYISKELHSLAKKLAPDQPKQLIKEIQFICAAALEASWKSRSRRLTYDSLPALVRGQQSTEPAGAAHKDPAERPRPVGVRFPLGAGGGPAAASAPSG